MIHVNTEILAKLRKSTFKMILSGKREHQGPQWTIEPCTGEDKDGVGKLLQKTMFSDEPLTSSLDDASRALYDDEIETAIINTLDQGHSFKAVTPEGRIVGAAINIACPYLYESYEPSQTILDLVQHVKQEIKLDSQGLLDLFNLAVDPDFRRQGMAKALAQATISYARSTFRGLYVLASSSYTTSVARSIGMEVIYSLAYQDYRNKDGSPVFIPPEPHTHLHVLLKLFPDG